MPKLSFASYIVCIVAAFILLPFLGLSTSYFYTRGQPRVYASAALLKLDTGRNLPSGSFDETFNTIDFQTEFEIIQSKKVLIPVIKEEKIDLLWAQQAGMGASSEDLSTYESSFYNRFKTQNLRVQPYRNTKLIEITIFDSDSKRARTWANAIARSYINYNKSQPGRENRAELVSEAEEGPAPIRPNIKLNMILGFICGVLLALAASLPLSLWFFLSRSRRA